MRRTPLLFWCVPGSDCLMVPFRVWETENGESPPPQCTRGSLNPILPVFERSYEPGFTSKEREHRTNSSKGLSMNSLDLLL